jgi:hypothetical protein
MSFAISTWWEGAFIQHVLDVAPPVGAPSQVSQDVTVLHPRRHHGKRGERFAVDADERQYVPMAQLLPNERLAADLLIQTL